MNKYNIYIVGRSLESRFYSISEDAAEFWQEQIDDEDSDLLYTYLEDREDIDIDEDYHFLGKNEDQYCAESLLRESQSFDSSECEVVIEQDDQEIHRFTLYDNSVDEYAIPVDWEENHPCVENPVLCINEYMKGTIFGGIVECENFDLQKLKVILSEDYFGEFALDKVYYDGQEIENAFLDQRGCGGSFNIIHPDDY